MPTPVFTALALCLTLLLSPVAAHAAAGPEDDPYLWLEAVDSPQSLAWVQAQNARTQPLLEATPGFAELQARLLAIATSRERIPVVTQRAGWLYNFWQDAAHPRGILRRTTLAQYRLAEPAWETVLDIDRLAADERVPWAYKGMDCLYPAYRRCLVRLSRGGADAVEVREFDMAERQFVPDGFRLPEAKQGAAWIDADTLYITRETGPGTLTRSGYPRIAQRWRRGTPLAEAATVFEGRETDVAVSAWVEHEPDRSVHRLRRATSVRVADEFVWHDGRWTLLDVPRDAAVSVRQGLLLLRLRSDWRVPSSPSSPAAAGEASGGPTFEAGTLIATDLARFLAGGRQFDRLFTPSPGVSLQDFTWTRQHLLLEILDHVKARVTELRRTDSGWQAREVAVPPIASIGLSAFDRDTSDAYWMTVTSFIEPTTRYLAEAGSDRRERLKALPAQFNARGLTVAQHQATSKDGTAVPYFVVMRQDQRLDGRAPTILYGYGGFEVSQTPGYVATRGAGWLEEGGVFVLANIRGGGEFGPAWHRVAQRAGRQKAHDDFIAVAEDLIRRQITSPAHLGILGGSQGGLLVGAAFTQRPELFKAVVSAVPLLDMKRYHKLLAGASWMGEYGDPDQPDDWAFIGAYSPYQNLRADRTYPQVFITTSTRDDRVHPGHARKMTARMLEQGHPVLYFENTEGGHAAGTTPAQQAYLNALMYAFFRQALR